MLTAFHLSDRINNVEDIITDINKNEEQIWKMQFAAKILLNSSAA